MLALGMGAAAGRAEPGRVATSPEPSSNRPRRAAPVVFRISGSPSRDDRMRRQHRRLPSVGDIRRIASSETPVRHWSRQCRADDLLHSGTRIRVPARRQRPDGAARPAAALRCCWSCPTRSRAGLASSSAGVPPPSRRREGELASGSRARRRGIGQARRRPKPWSAGRCRSNGGAALVPESSWWSCAAPRAVSRASLASEILEPSATSARSTESIRSRRRDRDRRAGRSSSPSGRSQLASIIVPARASPGAPRLTASRLCAPTPGPTDRLPSGNRWNGEDG